MSGAEAVLYVERLEAMAEFYARAFGLERAEQGRDFCELRSAGWRLWLVAGKGRATVGADGEVVRRSEVPVKLCMAVADLPAARAEIAARGGRCRDGEWRFGGYLRVDAVDPEGNVVQLLERVAGDAPAD